jgi:hypothetical protein
VKIKTLIFQNGDIAFTAGEKSLKGVTVIVWAKQTLSRELASQADSSERLVMLESPRNDPNQPFFSIITVNTAIME